MKASDTKLDFMRSTPRKNGAKLYVIEAEMTEEMTHGNCNGGPLEER